MTTKFTKYNIIGNKKSPLIYEKYLLTAAVSKHFKRQ